MNQTLFPLQFIALLISAMEEKEHYPRPLTGRWDCVDLQKKNQQEMAYDAAKSRKWERFIDQRRKILAISLVIARRKTFELLRYVQISR